MFGFKKVTPQANVSYERLKCNCGNENFRHTTNVTFVIFDYGEKGITKRPEAGEFCFECTKCGVLYDRYGEVVV